METLAKGNAAEAAVLNAFIQRGFPVLVPFGGGHAYDLVVDLGTAFLRVQCKSARDGDGRLKFNSCSTDHGRGRLSYVGLADAFGVYHAPTDKVYVVPVVGTPEFMVTLRLEPTRNNQRVGIRLASDYDIERWPLDRLLGIVGGHARSPTAASARVSLRAVG